MNNEVRNLPLSQASSGNAEHPLPLVLPAEHTTPSTVDGTAKEQSELAVGLPPILRPRAVKKRRTPKEERGLPPDSEIRKLATIYLETQRKMWNDVIPTELLPAPSSEILNLMVQDFKSRHGGTKVEPLPAGTAKACGKLGTAYSRYSCDNSRPESITDQLVGELRKAHEERIFIPWRYVFADYAVSGLEASRRGYSSHKALLSDPNHPINTVYIDDFTRASRDEIEWWKLASLIRRLGKRLRGASDDFDLAKENWDTQVGLYNILNRLFLNSLRQKVRRGSRGAARRGYSLGRPALGYTLTEAKNDQGFPIHGPDGQPIWTLCPDPETQKYVVMAFELYGESRWSMGRIARRFNQLRVDGGNGWTASSIRQLLTRLLYIGIFIYNRTRHEREPDTGKVVTITNPRKDWEVKKMPHLRLVPNELWKKAWRRLQQTRKNHPLTGRPWSRNANSASTLFSGTLCCEYCSTAERPRELVLNRSSGKYKVMACLAGVQRRHECKLTASKSVRIIEDSLLRFLRNTLIDDSIADRLLHEGNAYIAAQASRPRSDTSPLKTRAKDLTKKIDKLVKLVEDEPDEATCRGYHRRITFLQGELNQVSVDLKTKESQNRPPPRPLNREDVLRSLGSLREVLNQEIPAAAEMIRAITGPIMISQTPNKVGKRGAIWVAKFTPRVLPALAKVAKEQGYPDSLSLEYLSTRIWIMPKAESCEIVHTGKFERLLRCQHFIGLRQRNCSINAIAKALNKPYSLVRDAIAYETAGKRPVFKAPGKRRPAGTPVPEKKYIFHAEAVAKLKDGEGLSFKAIAARLGMNSSTAARAYFFRQVTLGETNGVPLPAKFSHVGYTKIRQIRQLIAEGTKVADVASRVGCSVNTVYRAAKGEGLR